MDRARMIDDSNRQIVARKSFSEIIVSEESDIGLKRHQRRIERPLRIVDEEIIDVPTGTDSDLSLFKALDWMVLLGTVDGWVGLKPDDQNIAFALGIFEEQMVSGVKKVPARKGDTDGDLRIHLTKPREVGRIDLDCHFWERAVGFSFLFLESKR